MSTLFNDRATVTVKALFVGQRIDLRDFEKGTVLARAPLMVSAGASGCAVLFRYGVIVLFGLDSVEEVKLLSDIKSLITEPFPNIERDSIDVVKLSDEEEGISKSRIVLRDFDYKRLQIVSNVLAKSVILGFYEGAIAESFDRIEPIASSLQKGGHGRHQIKELIKYIGDTLSIQSKMVGRAEISEKPELIWEYPEHEKLYLRLEDEYELSERYIALEGKLDLISKTAETLLGLLQETRSLRVEWYIVILILFEILLTLYEMWWPK